jgi:predicted tellurium resistance membrane protein TerC
MDWIAQPESWIALLTLTVLEIVLGIDNIVMITIIADRLPAERQKRARQLGLALAMLTRIALLGSIAWLIGLTAPLFNVIGLEISGRDLILSAGGLFLLAKATHEIHSNLEGGGNGLPAGPTRTMRAALLQIILFDLVFSLDSVITAVGMVEEVAVMVTAIVVAVLVMVVSIEPISRFVSSHPTVKMLALSFLILIGVALIAEAFDQHLPRGYIYFAFGFSIFVEMLNMRIRDGRQDAGPREGDRGGGGPQPVTVPSARG